MLPALAISLSAAVLVNALIQSTARLWVFVVTGTARSEPPRNPGMIFPGECLGRGNAPADRVGAGSPRLASSGDGHSRPPPLHDATLRLPHTTAFAAVAASV